MNLYEFEAEGVLRGEGVKVPDSIVVATVEGAVEAYRRLGRPVMVKVQVLTVGRAKAGGIIAAEDESEVRGIASRLLNSTVKGLPVYRLLVQERVQVARELYVGLTVDRGARRPVLMVCGEGGVEVEELAAERPEGVVKEYVDPLGGLLRRQVEDAASKIDLVGEAAEMFTDLLQKMYRVFLKFDCELLEVNPLALTPEGDLLPLDVKMVVDDNALFRHPEFRRVEGEAVLKGLSFVPLDGDIGVIGNGAGLVMATMDVVAHFGGRPSCFCDVGGGADAERVTEAVKLVLKQLGVKVLVVNILGGITLCSDVANGLVDALKTVGRPVPVLVRLAGAGEEEGRVILDRAGLRYTESMEEAVREALSLVRRG